MDWVNLITDGEILVNAIGHWPSFHDAEIETLHFSRDRPSLHAIIQVPHRDAWLSVAMDFEGIADLLVEGFNEQNVLSEIVIKGLDGQFFVEMFGIYGASASFSSESIRVRGVRWCDSDPWQR